MGYLPCLPSERHGLSLEAKVALRKPTAEAVSYPPPQLHGESLLEGGPTGKSHAVPVHPRTVGIASL